MRRTYKARGDALVRSEAGEQGFWPSYADMMSAVALILFFLMLLSYIQNLITGNDLQNTQEVLAETRATLDLTLGQVDEAKSDLEKVTIDLAEAQLTLDELKGKLDDQNAQLAEQKKELAAQDKLLADQKALIGEQETYLKAANKELLEMLKNAPAVAVINKTDLENRIDSEYIRSKVLHTVFISAKTGNGEEELRREVADIIGTSRLDASQGILATERQYYDAKAALTSIEEALSALRAGVTFDAVTVVIEDGINSLSELTGERVTEAVVDKVFSRFCVGK